MTLGQAQKIDVDVEERISWGIDISVAVNILNVLPNEIPLKEKSEFIEHKIVYALQ